MRLEDSCVAAALRFAFGHDLAGIENLVAGPNWKHYAHLATETRHHRLDPGLALGLKRKGGLWPLPTATLRRGLLSDIELFAIDGLSRRQPALRDPTGPIRRVVRPSGRGE